MSIGKFAFLPNMRSAAAAEASLAGVRPRLSYDIEIIGNNVAQGARVPVSATLKGPGDVIGIDPEQIIRIEPEEGNKGFEPNYFPFVQFKDPDLPWRYSLDSATGDRIMPWLALIALKEDEFTYLNQGNALAPRIEVASVQASLPDLGQAWATAHVQVDMDGVTGSPAEVVLRDPGRGFSRLFACRKLEAGTSYTLFLVPCYRVGLEAALGEGADDTLGRTLAWEAARTGAQILPYFFRHRFRTETGQDLEALLRKLRAVRADEEAKAGAPLWVSGQDVGYYRGAAFPDYRFAAQAALTRPDPPDPGFTTPDPLVDKMVQTLNTVLSEAGDDPDEQDVTDEGAVQEDPLLAFPAYGAHFAEAREISKRRAKNGGWFEFINLDLKFRAAAGLGQAIVRENDEHFAQLCWEQYDEVLAANQALRQLQLASLLAGRMEQRHFSRLPNETGVQLSEPLMGFVRKDPGDERSGSLKGWLQDRNVPGGFTSLSLRRTLSRKPERVPDGKDGAPRRRVPMAALPGDKSPSRAAMPRPDGALRRRVKTLSGSRHQSEVSNALAGIFNVEMLGRKPKPQVPEAVVGAYSSARIKKLVGDKLTALPRQKADYLIGGRSAAEIEDGGVIYRAPRVPEPLIDYLTRFSRDAVLSNAAALPENTVSIFAENRHFIEAMMTGANHAMNEELRWREYPTDMRGTVFHRFWNRGAEPDDTSQDDIGEIREWSGKLGKNPNPADADGKSNLVVVIKGEVVRKLSNPLVVISIAGPGSQGGGADANGPIEWDPANSVDHDPVFFGKIGRDAVYFGFDVSRDYLMSDEIRDRAFFVIYEPPARLRFGLDVGNAAVRSARPAVPSDVLGMATPDLKSWDDLSWKHMQLTASDYVDFAHRLARPRDEDTNYWGAVNTKHSAGLARSFWQKPVAAVLPLGRVL